MTTALTVVPGVAGDAPALGTLFSGLCFFFVQRLPTRSSFVHAVEANGGKTVRLEQQAHYVIADHLRRDAPTGSLSYTFIEEALRTGRLPDPAKHAIERNARNVRAVGSCLPGKNTRRRFTEEEDRILLHWVKEKRDYGACIKGNAIYKELEALHPQHTYQSWRDRYLKKMDDRPACAAVSTLHGEMKVFAKRLRQTRGFEHFTADDFALLLNNAQDIEDVDETQVLAAWSQWAEAHQQHSAEEWRLFYSNMVRPTYLARRDGSGLLIDVDTQGRVHGSSTSATQSRRGSPSGQMVTPTKRRRNVASESVAEHALGACQDTAVGTGSHGAAFERFSPRLAQSNGLVNSVPYIQDVSQRILRLLQLDEAGEPSNTVASSEADQFAEPQLQNTISSTRHAAPSCVHTDGATNADDYSMSPHNDDFALKAALEHASRWRNSDVGNVRERSIKHAVTPPKTKKRRPQIDSPLSRSPSAEIKVKCAANPGNTSKQPLTAENLATQQSHHIGKRSSRGVDLDEDGSGDDLTPYVDFLQQVVSNDPILWGEKIRGRQFVGTADHPLFMRPTSFLPTDAEGDGSNVPSHQNTDLHMSLRNNFSNADPKYAAPSNQVVGLSTDEGHGSSNHLPVSIVPQEVLLKGLPLPASAPYQSEQEKSQIRRLEDDQNEVFDWQNLFDQNHVCGSHFPYERTTLSQERDFRAFVNGQAGGELDNDRSSPSWDDIDFTVPEPDGGFPPGSPGQPVHGEHHSEPVTHVHLELDSAACDSPLFNRGRRANVPDAQAVETQDVETQDIMDAETQHAGLQMMLLPSSEEELEHSFSAKSGRRVRDDAQVESRQGYATGERSSKSSSTTPDLRSWFAEMQAQGFDDASIVRSIKCASMRPDLALLVLHEEKAGNGLPNDIPGVWSEEDDEVVEGSNAPALRLLEAKHGWDECVARRKMLESFRKE